MQHRGRSGQPVKGRRANKPMARKVSTSSMADLQKQISALTRELKEANERQSATADVLQVINSSPGDSVIVGVGAPLYIGRLQRPGTVQHVLMEQPRPFDADVAEAASRS